MFLLYLHGGDVLWLSLFWIFVVITGFIFTILFGVYRLLSKRLKIGRRP